MTWRWRKMKPPFLFLENALDRDGKGKLFSNPSAFIRCDAPEFVSQSLTEIDKALANGKYVAGFMAYELGYALEEKLAVLMPPERAVPLLWFGVFDGFESTSLAGTEENTSISNLRPSWPPNYYAQAFDKVKNYIVAGDVYQIDLTFKMLFDYAGNPQALYAALREKQHARHAAFLGTEDFHLLSFSPELFFSVENGVITSRPMKGTASRGGSEEADKKLAFALNHDPKQLAENLMIVDLMRNDLGRLAEIGSVEVTDLYTVEALETVQQMSSGIKARLKAQTKASDIIRAIFPCGSVVGAPKIHAMEIIRRLEPLARGAYTGAVGFFAPDGSASFNVAIRTAMLKAGKGEMGVGSGVVMDSIEQLEYEECLLKAKFLADTVPFQLFETMLWQKGRGYSLLQRHLARLEASAAHFGFVCDVAAINNALIAHAKGLKNEAYRVRLVLHPNGEVHITSQSFVPKENAIWRAKISASVIDPADLFNYHKTTRRDLYNRELEIAKLEDFDEVIFFNNRGELCEGAISNLFVQLDGKLVTPSLSCGLLPGTLRAEMLENGKAVEGILTRADLARAESLFAGNSVRGLVALRI
jgi:para-aminobenzoate synthetase/4-amino-4-deoxychorismate lyase